MSVAQQSTRQSAGKRTTSRRSTAQPLATTIARSACEPTSSNGRHGRLDQREQRHARIAAAKLILTLLSTIVPHKKQLTPPATRLPPAEGAQRAVHRRRLRPTTPRRCGSSGAALVARRRSPARWSSHTRSTTACKGPRARRGVVQTPEPHSGRAMGAAHLPGQPASRLHPHALVRAAFDNTGSDRHGLWVRHADTHAQSNTPGARGLTVRRSPSIGRAEARATDATRGDSRALLDESTAARGESASREWRVGEFQGATRRHTHGRVAGRAVHSLTPLDPPLFGEAPSAGVDSPPRVGPRRGRVDRSPLPCAPPLPLRALPTA